MSVAKYGSFLNGGTIGGGLTNPIGIYSPSNPYNVQQPMLQPYGITEGGVFRYADTTQLYSYTAPMAYSGNRFLVVCNGSITELPDGATIEQAQDKAEQLAHQSQGEAFILKPVRKVAPKRDVVTTDL